MQRCFLFLSLLLGGLLTSHAYAQDVPPVATQANEASGGSSQAPTQAEAEVEADPKLTSLELVKQLTAAEPDAQFLMLPQVSPRGVDRGTRVEIVTLLLPLLKSEYPDIRARAAAAIGLFGVDSEFAIPELLELIGDQEQTASLKPVWTVVSQALSGIGDAAIEPAMERLSSDNEREFNGITSIIAELGDTPAARAAAPYFLEQLKIGPENRKWATMYCLSRLGDVAKPAIPDYIQYLDHPQFNLQVIACRALAALGAASKSAVPKLVTLMEKNGNMLSTRTHAAMCLGAIGPVDEFDVDLVGLFKSMISEPNAFCQERGLIALGRLGNHARDAAPFVESLFDREDFSQRPQAALTLWQISGNAERSVALLKPMIDDPTYEFQTLEAIGIMGPAAASLAEPLAARLHTDDASLQLEIAQALESMGPVATQYLEQLRPMANAAPPDIGIQIDAIVAFLDTIRQEKTTPPEKELGN